MNIVLRAALALMPAAIIALPQHPASGSVTVFGNGEAQTCAQAARMVSEGRAPPPQAIEACTLALDFEALPLRDLAGTHVNRGVLLLARAAYADAKQDFDAAVALGPGIGESYTDRGAAQVGLGHYAEAIADIDKGLRLVTDEPEKAYFNRALADEGLDDLKSAYYDYLHASQLKPDWPKPREELARFTVVAQPGT